MLNFNYQNGTKLIFGKNTEESIGTEVKKYSKKVLLHYGGGSIKKSGLYDRIINSLNKEDIEIFELSGVKPNPRVSLVREGIEICRKENINFILAVGGGSVIDSAKAITAGVNYEGDVWDLFTGTPINHELIKLATVLTIPAAGSETSSGSVITNEDGWMKRAVGHEDMRPVFSILNPELTFTLPKYQTSCGVADMIAHVMERYFVNEKHVDLTDRLCEATMKSIIENGLRLMKNPDDYNARAEIMLCGTVAHNGSLDIGRGGDWASHDIEHELSGIYDIAHGAGLSIIFPAWMKFVYKHDINRFAQFGNRVFNLDINLNNPEETALLAIKKLEEFFKDMELPVSFKDANLSSDRIEEMAKKLVSDRDHVGSFVEIREKEALEIYKLAL
ncbi:MULTISPECIES: iron-containing alcohol dehydrogenase [unclassified Clostridium]|uniref:iron-containing alcohol dehydrogenase n=1 Tax=Clostridium TaxID=1485 RepID=UPI001C8CC7EC|nr:MULTISPECIES: iron-containing alcohol dehydrogenase [unclassified Clostridium]MBX9136873.1 iron-containing alcohol dehydrogenase [Clostridium sp. K12(2020)]MBX9143683.1 iron-containing alcohol dehydrogenase [Clostridium sp. K13]MDU2291448.1 iron-containing alcohol dehydrogenase [Clostridium celatum]